MELTFTSTDDNSSTYNFTVDGEIYDTDSMEGSDSFDSTSADGMVWVEGASDTYYIRGSIIDLHYDSGMDVFVDGNDISSGYYQDIVFNAIGGIETYYDFETDGYIRDSESLEWNDDKNFSNADGKVHAWKKTDEYTINGGLTDLTLSSNQTARVTVDGTAIAGGVRERTMDTGRETIELAIYQTRDLVGMNGRIPEQMVALHAAEAFDRAGYDYRITYNHVALDSPSETAVCGDDCPLSWLRDEGMAGNLPNHAKDSNLLITSADGGGCGYVGGTYATAPGGEIDYSSGLSLEGTDSRQSNFLACIHEIGHNLGLHHNDGMAWVEGDDWVKTPMVDQKGSNNCGEPVPYENDLQRVNRLEFADCAVSKFLVR